MTEDLEASGPIIPNTLFPIHVSGATYRNSKLINPFLGTFDVPALNNELCCPFNVDGHSHFPIFYADNLDFMPAGTNPVGAWEFEITMTDNTGNIDLNGGANFVTASGDRLTLQYDGTRWFEIGRTDT